MLHAELAGKIAPDADDIARREDVLTSTVFGTLFLADAWPWLLRWIAQAKPVGHRHELDAGDAITDGTYWFWPRLYDAEPDLVIRCGSTLLVIEAKYLSGKSGSSVLDGSTVVEASDQLVREWRACCVGVDTHGYPQDLCDAIADCDPHLIYLVRRAHWARELRAVEESAAQLANARFHLLTWEDLDEVLAAQEVRWARELRAYLHRRGVAAFRGFAGALRAPAAVEGWCYREESRPTGPRGALTSTHRDAARQIEGTPSRFRRTISATWMAWARIAARLDRSLVTKLAARPAAFGSPEDEDG